LGVALKDPGGKMMDNRTLTQKTGRARGHLMRLERQLVRAREDLKGATRNRIVGGVVLLIGMIALIQSNVVIAVAGLLIGGWVFIRARGQIGQERRSIDRITDRVTDARAKLAELKAQPSVAD
jgi:hypothetical protein